LLRNDIPQSLGLGLGLPQPIVDLDPIALCFDVPLCCTNAGTAPRTLSSAVGQGRQATILVGHHMSGHRVSGQLGIMGGQPHPT